MPSVPPFAPLNRPEFSLAVATCKWPPSEMRTAELEGHLHQAIDWELFLRAVERHRIAGLANHALSRVGDGFVPSAIRLELRRRADAMSRHSLQTAFETSRIVNLFSKAGIRCLVLKGAPLAMLAYQDLGVRHTRDSDLLVSPADSYEADEVLSSSGYRRIKPEPSASLRHVKLHQKSQHEFEYVHKTTGQVVELHHRLHSNFRFSTASILGEDLTEHETVDLGGGLKVDTLAKPDLLAFLCAHGSRHAWFRLKWLADVGALLAANADNASSLLITARAQGTQRSAMQALLLCHYLWGMPLPAQMPAAGWAVRRLVGSAYAAMTAGNAVTEPQQKRFGIARITGSQYLLSSNPRYLWNQALKDYFAPVDIGDLPTKLEFLYPLIRFPMWLKRRLAFSKPTAVKPTSVTRGEMVHSYFYVISGLAVLSEVQIPSAISVPREDRVPDVIIRGGAVPSTLNSPLRSAETWEAAPGIFLLRISGIGNFLIRDGREILFDRDGGCDLRTLALFLLGSCFAILLQQRGNIVLHASGVTAGGRAMLFCGQSGAGKSTMAALLCERGYALLNDDVCNLVPTPNDAYEVRPDGRMLKLWRESMDNLDLEKHSDMAVRPDVEKYFTAPPVSEIHGQQVGAVYILEEALPDEESSIHRLRPLNAMLALKRNAYRPFLLGAMDMEAAYFHASAAIQRSAGIFSLRRQKNFSDADAVLRLLEEHWKSLASSASLGATAWNR